MKKQDFIRQQLEGLTERNRERAEKRRMAQRESLQRQKMGTAISYERQQYLLDRFNISKKRA